MKTQRISWRADSGIVHTGAALREAQLVLYFGTPELLANPLCLAELRAHYPKAMMFGCSSGGQIVNMDVADDALSAVAIRFERTRLKAAVAHITGPEQSGDCGAKLAQALSAPDLAGVLVLSDGLNVNGSPLVAGFVKTLGRNVPICGGLAGDGANFKNTLVGLNSEPKSHVVAAIGLYGSAVHVGHGSAGGWDVFGPNRSITRSANNVLYELDGQPALDLYERYLGPEDAQGLPGTALRFPLLIRNPDCSGQELVRTILSIDREARSMTFAGDIPRGWNAQLMRSSFEHLADGAARASAEAGEAMADARFSGDTVGILISCIGRRLMMGQHVVEEIEAACSKLPAEMTTVGFYSYGEISPHPATGYCELHNQTMTVMTIAERAA